MESNEIEYRDFSNEFEFSTSRSGGPGGQNVNKVSTKVELRFSIISSLLLSEEEKRTLLIKLSNKVNKDGYLILVSQSERTQLGNKEKVIEKFYNLISKALTPQKKRKATKPSKQSKEKRLEVKKIHSDRKTLRRKIDL